MALLSNSGIERGAGWTDGVSTTLMTSYRRDGEKGDSGGGDEEMIRNLRMGGSGSAEHGGGRRRKGGGKNGGAGVAGSDSGPAEVVRSRGFRDMEGEANAVASKMSELIRSKDLVGALEILRFVQVGAKYMEGD